MRQEIRKRTDEMSSKPQDPVIDRTKPAAAGGARRTGERQFGNAAERDGPIARLLAEHQERVGDVVDTNVKDIQKEDGRDGHPSVALIHLRSDCLTALKTASYIFGVTTPVLVFCRDG